MIASFQLSHVILESTRLSDGPCDATTSLDASVDDSRDGVSDALQVESVCYNKHPLSAKKMTYCNRWKLSDGH